MRLYIGLWDIWGKTYKTPIQKSYLLIHQFLSFELMEIRYKIFN